MEYFETVTFFQQIRIKHVRSFHVILGIDIGNGSIWTKDRLSFNMIGFQKLKNMHLRLFGTIFETSKDCSWKNGRDFVCDWETGLHKFARAFLI